MITLSDYSIQIDINLAHIRYYAERKQATNTYKEIRKTAKLLQKMINTFGFDLYLKQALAEDSIYEIYKILKNNDMYEVTRKRWEIARDKDEV